MSDDTNSLETDDDDDGENDSDDVNVREGRVNDIGCQGIFARR